MFCNNVSVLCLHVIVTDYVLSGEIAGNKHPVLLLLLFKYLGATLTDREWRLGCGDGASILLKETRACVCVQNWTNFCPYALISTPNVP